jgi:ribosomal protein S27AE
MNPLAHKIRQSIKRCSFCKGELPAHRQRYCCDRCSYSQKIEIAKIRRSRLVHDLIKCATCCTSFIPKTSRQKYCNAHCWQVENNKRRAAKREATANNPKMRCSAARFMPSWGSPTFGERTVTKASFVNSKTPERLELKSAVEDFLNKGGEITRYGDEIVVKNDDSVSPWQLPESEEKKIQAELSRIWGVSDVLGY